MKKISVSIGDKYGKLTILKEVNKINNQRAFKCKCECGNIKNLVLNRLRLGNTKSCGCLKKEIKTTHGKSKNILYRKFFTILDRCKNKNNIGYKDYGARGIKFEWKSFEDFYKDMGDTYKEGLQIDRIDNNGNYSKENCRWITPKQNSRNRRNNVLYKGKCLAEWCEIKNLKYSTVYMRIQYGWTLEQALELK